jgi:hypothetical protein
MDLLVARGPVCTPYRSGSLDRLLTREHLVEPAEEDLVQQREVVDVGVRLGSLAKQRNFAPCDPATSKYREQDTYAGEHYALRVASLWAHTS